MKIVKPAYQIMKPDLDDPKSIAAVYQSIEESGRTCYQSEAAMTEESGEKFVRMMVKNGHDAMLEHAYMKVKFIVDRGISHELVRHRLCSFAQESTRYCNYTKGKFGNEITVIEPCFYSDIPEDLKTMVRDYIRGWTRPIETGLFNTVPTIKMALYYDLLIRYSNWYTACIAAQRAYMDMLKNGATPEEARSVLPTSLKTEIVITANMREWRHMFKLRAAGETGKPHPQMLEVMVPLLNECKMKLPALFEDIEPMEMGGIYGTGQGD